MDYGAEEWYEEIGVWWREGQPWLRVEAAMWVLQEYKQVAWMC